VLRSSAHGSDSLKFLLPGTFLGFKSLDRSAHFFSIGGIAGPDYSEAGALLAVLNYDQVCTTKQLLDSPQECTVATDIAGESALRKRQPLCINALDEYWQVGVDARLSPAINLHSEQPFPPAGPIMRFHSRTRL